MKLKDAQIEHTLDALLDHHGQRPLQAPVRARKLLRELMDQPYDVRCVALPVARALTEYRGWTLRANPENIVDYVKPHLPVIAALGGEWLGDRDLDPEATYMAGMVGELVWLLWEPRSFK